MRSLSAVSYKRSDISARRVSSLTKSFSFLAGLLLLAAAAQAQTFVQANSNTVAVNAATVSVKYANPETAGNLNVVVVGWNDTSSSITSVVDDNANTYFPVGTTAGRGLSQAIYYARNIVVAPNATPTVTVTFNQTAGVPDVRVVEYSGLSTTAPLDNWTGNVGQSTAADSGMVSTSSNDLIFGGGTTASAFSAAGTGFTSRLITSPFGDIVEDSNSSLPAGGYNGTASVAAPKAWAMQVVGFSVGGVTYPNAPVISTTAPISPTSGTDGGGLSVTITGTNFQPGAIVLFGTAPGGISGVNCAETGGTTITCLTPADSDGAKDVTVINVDGQSSSAPAAYTFENVTPTIATVTPATGPTNGGTAVTITGTNFQVGAKVLIGGLPAGNVIIQDNTTITVLTPGFAVSSADVTVNNPGGGTATKNLAFAYTAGTGPVNFVQRGGAASAGTAATLVAALPNVQTAGNLNAVVIGWNDITTTVTAVTDTEGNTYTAALPATAGSAMTQVIYYAKNIVGDSGVTPNSITVTFSQAALAPDVQVLEYRGLDVTGPLDAAAGHAGSGLLADSGTCTTVAPVDLILAGTTVSNTVSAPGAGFNLVNLTSNGDASEHQITSSPGSCEATTALRDSGTWVTQAVAFKATAAPTPDFTIAATPASQTVVAGTAGAYTVSLAAVNGFNSSVALTCSAITLPAGVSCAFDPSSVVPAITPATSALSLSTSASTPVGTSNVTVTGTSGSTIHSKTVSLTVNPAPDFTITGTALTPASVTAGTAATSTITVAPLHGFNTAVGLSCSITAPAIPTITAPPTCGFVPTSIAAGTGTSALTVSTSATTTPGAYVVTVAGSGSINHSTVLNLAVTAPPVPDFGIAATALTPASVAAGSSATSTVTITPANGFNGAVSLACSITPAVSRPATCSFNPASVANGSGTSVLTVNTVAPTTASLAKRPGVFFALWLPISGLAFLGTGMVSRKKRLLAFLAGCLVFSGLIFLAACGGGSSGGGGGGGHPGTPAGSYTVTVTGTGPSGAPAHSTTLTVAVH